MSRAERRHFNLCINTLKRAARTGQELGVQDKAQIRIGWQEAVEIQNHRLILRFVWAGWSVLQSLGSWEQAVQWLQQGLDSAAKLSDRHMQGSLWDNLGAVYRDQHAGEKARHAYEQALSIFEELDDHECQPKALNGLGLMAQDSNQSVEAIKFYERALELFKEVPDVDGQASVLNNMGEVYFQAGQFEQARSLYLEVLALWRSVDDPVRIGLGLCNLGAVERFRLDSLPKSQQGALFDEIESYFQEALRLFRQTNELYFQAVVLTNLSELYHYANKIKDDLKMLEYANEALAIYDKQINQPLLAATVVANLGSFYGSQGDQIKALSYDTQALERYERLNQRPEMATLYNNIAFRYESREELGEALIHYEKALVLYEELGQLRGQAQALEKISRLYLLQRNFEAALTQGEIALALYERIKDKPGLARTLNNLGLAKAYVGQLEQARAHYYLALTLANELEDEVLRENLIQNMARHELPLPVG